MGKPLVHVLVINWNGREHLQACFDSLLAQAYTNAQYILIDNASTDDSVGFVRGRYGGDSRVEILECGANLGWSGGNNLGMQRALDMGADYVFLLNNDTATAPDAIETLVEFGETRREAGAIAPKMLLFDQPFLINSISIACSLVAGAWDEGLGRLDGPRWTTEKKVLGVCGGAMFLRCDTLRKTGLFPDDFEIYLDDLDLCLRIWDAGYECWSCPSATVRHKFSSTMGEGARARRKYYLNTRNRLRLILRNYPARQLPSTCLHYACAEAKAIGRATLDGEGWKAAAHVRSWLSALRYIPRAIRYRRSASVCGAFWPMLVRDRYFFEGTELPRDGWYAEREVGGCTYRPISLCATADVRAGRLSVSHTNCYPRLGATHVEVINNDRRLGVLSTGDRAEAVFEVEAGRIEFRSHRVFDAEATGERFDIGGWIALNQLAE